ncbi:MULTISPECIES: hypothetical protein [Kosakonia]|nr:MULTISPECIES: hypothetical protein [Kosakonia]MDD7995391.1 hypothetical protein [Kosakonia radicincitans]
MSLLEISVDVLWLFKKSSKNSDTESDDTTSMAGSLLLSVAGWQEG